MRSLNELLEIIRIKKASLDSELNTYMSVLTFADYDDLSDQLKSLSTGMHVMPNGRQEERLDKLYFLENTYRKFKSKAINKVKKLNKDLYDYSLHLNGIFQQHKYDTFFFKNIPNAHVGNLLSLIEKLKDSQDPINDLRDSIEIKNIGLIEWESVSTILFLVHLFDFQDNYTINMLSKIQKCEKDIMLFDNAQEQYVNFLEIEIKKVKKEMQLSLVDKSNSGLAQLKETFFNKKNIINENKILSMFLISLGEDFSIIKATNQEELNLYLSELKRQYRIRSYLQTEGFFFGKSMNLEDLYFVRLSGLIFPMFIKRRWFYEIKKIKNKNHIQELNDKIKNNKINLQTIKGYVKKVCYYEKTKKYFSEKYLDETIELIFNQKKCEVYCFEEFSSFEEFCGYYYYYNVFFKYCKDSLIKHENPQFMSDEFILFLIRGDDSILNTRTIVESNILDFLNDVNYMKDISLQFQRSIDSLSEINFLKETISFIRNSYSHKRFYTKTYYEDSEEIYFTETSDYGNKKIKKYSDKVEVCVNSEIVEINIPTDLYIFYVEAILTALSNIKIDSFCD